MNHLKNKAIIFLLMLCIVSFTWSCINNDTSYINYKLVEINYENLNYCILTNNKEDFRLYDTIQNNKNARLRDTTRVYFPSLFNTFESSNNVSFIFLNDGNIKFIDKSKNFQLIAKEFKNSDSIFVLKNNSIEAPIFVACQEDNNYQRTLSAYRVIYELDGQRKDSTGIVNNSLIDLDYLKNEFKLNQPNITMQSDTIIWINLIYKYS